MPRMSKKQKQELAFFLNSRGRKTYNDLCRKCQRDCRQSSRAVIVECPVIYQSAQSAERRTPTEWNLNL